MKTCRLLLNIIFPALVVASCTSFVAAVERGRGEYQSRRIKSTANSENEVVRSADAVNARQRNGRNKGGPQRKLVQSRRARGSKGKQGRRELSKSSGKSGSGKSGSGKSGSGKSSSGKSGSSGGSRSSGGSGVSSGSNGSSSSGGSSSVSTLSSAGWSAYDGSYCGCLCMSNYASYGIDTHNESCDFAVDQTSYGYGLR